MVMEVEIVPTKVFGKIVIDRVYGMALVKILEM